MRNQQLNRYNMASGVMDDLREKLEEIKQLEREGIQRRLMRDNQEAPQPGSNQRASIRPASPGWTTGQQGQSNNRAAQQQQAGQSRAIRRRRAMRSHA